MSNYIEYNDKIAFHPGYYIKEIIEESGLSQKDFAKRLDTTPKNLSILVRGEQSLSIDIAMKLSRMLGTSVDYWLNLQKSYDAFVKMNEFSENAIRRFAERIDRDPGIVLDRLQNDQIVPFTNVALSKALKHKYKVITS